MKYFVFYFFVIIVFIFSPKVKAQSVGGVSYGTHEYCWGSNTGGFVSLAFQVGLVTTWESSIDSINWQAVPNSASVVTLSYDSLLSQTTWYRAIVQNGAFPPDTSTISKITIYPPALAGTLSGGGVFCASSGNGTLNLTGTQGNILHWESSVNNGPWQIISNTNPSYTYTSISQNTSYRVIVKYIATCPFDTSNTVSFTISPQTVAGTLSASDTICLGQNGDTLKLTGNTGAITNWQFSLNNGNTWNNISNLTDTLIYSNIDTNTWYRVEVKSGVCPIVYTNPAKLVLVNPEQANAGVDKEMIQYKNCVLAGSGSGAPSWSPPADLDNPLSFTPTATPHNTTTYTLTLTDKHSCITHDTMVVTVIVPIPSAITPNGDGVNDILIIDKLIDYPSNSLSIVNRWGMEVYNAAPYKNDWKGVNMNGKDLPDDIYYYVFDYGTDKGIASGYILIKR